MSDVIVHVPAFGSASVLAELYDAEVRLLERTSARYGVWLEDSLRVSVGLPALHARFTGPTPRKRYSRRQRRRRRWL